MSSMRMATFTSRCKACGSILLMRTGCVVCADRKRRELHASGIAHSELEHRAKAAEVKMGHGPIVLSTIKPSAVTSPSVYVPKHVREESERAYGELLSWIDISCSAAYAGIVALENKLDASGDKATRADFIEVVNRTARIFYPRRLKESLEVKFPYKVRNMVADTLANRYNAGWRRG